MTDASEFRFGSSEYEQERKRREHERFQAEVNGWEPPKPRVVGHFEFQRATNRITDLTAIAKQSPRSIGRMSAKGKAQ